MKKIVVLVVVFIVLLAISAIADVDTGYSCSMDCESLSQNNDSYYCNPNTQTCFLVETPPEPVDPNATIPVTEAAPAELTTEEKVATLEEKLVDLQQSLETGNQDIATIKNQLAGLQVEIATIKGSIQTGLNTQTNSLATGLAGLQQGVDQTQQKINEVQETLNQRQKLNRFLTVMFFLIIIGAVGGAIYHFVTRKQKMLSPENLELISKNIKQGKKLPQIKQELRKAGWKDSDIEKAYQETVKKNYQQYKSSQSGSLTEISKTSTNNLAGKPAKRSSMPAYDPKKMMIIAVVSILVITGAIFILRGIATGEAISLIKLIGGQEGGRNGEITYKVECTPPHLLNPAGDACCLDSDNSGVCDTTELQGVGLTRGGDCSDNRECRPGLYCIANKCSSLDSLYTGEGDCSKLCTYYAVKMLTSDGETYDLKPKQGSYTGAGALEWKLLEMPKHCKGEAPIVPINILKKQTGEIISEEVILLHEGEESQVFTHPTVSKLAFSLTVADVFESCPK